MDRVVGVADEVLAEWPEGAAPAEAQQHGAVARRFAVRPEAPLVRYGSGSWELGVGAGLAPGGGPPTLSQEPVRASAGPWEVADGGWTS